MLELNWQPIELSSEEKILHRREIIDWNIKRFLELRGTNLLLKDKFYPKEIERIKEAYPRLQVFVGKKTNESPKDKRRWYIIEKVV